MSMSQIARFAKHGVPRTQKEEQPRWRRYHRLDRRFDTKLSCAHTWVPVVITSEREASDPTHFCSVPKCTATATFDADNRLVEYEADVKFSEDR